MYIPRRFIITAYTFLGFMVMLFLRANLSIALVDMTSSRNVTVDNRTQVKVAEFHWSSLEQGVIIGSFNYGYFFAPIGGILAARYGGATVFGLGILITGCLTVLTPFFCRIHFLVFILTRAFEGIFEAFSIASVIVLFVHWAHPDERARLITFSFSGAYLGTSLNYPISGYLADAYGWETVFYVSGEVKFSIGVIALLWYLLWISFVTNRPDKHPSISEEERAYLKENNRYGLKKIVAYPWMKIITSKAVWALFCHRFASSWASVFILLSLPTYFNGLFNMSITGVGFFSSIPHFATMLSQHIAAIMMDCLRNRRYLSSTTVHKSFTCGSYVLKGVLLFTITKCTTPTQALVCLTTLKLGSSFGETSYYALPADLSPSHSGALSGFSTACYSAGSILSPIILGAIVRNVKDQQQWNYYFLMLSAIMFAAGFIFLIFGSGDQQSWAEEEIRREDERNTGVELLTRSYLVGDPSQKYHIVEFPQRPGAQSRTNGVPL